jgi:hypothetical protein
LIAFIIFGYEWCLVLIDLTDRIAA